MRAIVRLLRNLYVIGRLSDLALGQMVVTGVITETERSFIQGNDSDQ